MDVAKVKAMNSLLDEWMNDTSGYDETTWPVIAKAISRRGWSHMRGSDALVARAETAEAECVVLREAAAIVVDALADMHDGCVAGKEEPEECPACHAVVLSGIISAVESTGDKAKQLLAEHAAMRAVVDAAKEWLTAEDSNDPKVERLIDALDALAAVTKSAEGGA